MLDFPKWKIIMVVGICLTGLVFALPNLLARDTAESLPKWLPHLQINLGLDLQGGSHLLLEVQTEAVVRERLQDMVQATRGVLRTERIGYTGLGVQGQSVRLRIRDPGDQARALEILRELATPIQPSLFGGGGGRDIEVEGGDDGLITIRLSEQAIAVRKQSAVTQSIEIVRRRVDETGTREPTIQRQGEERILVQLPGVDDPDRIKRLLGKTAKMVFRLVDVNTSVSEAQRGRVPPGSELLDSDDEVDSSGAPIQYVVRKRVMVSGENLIDAQPTYQQGEPVVSFRFDTVGGRRFGQVTAENVGRPFAIVLDGKVISAPVIREAILGGSGIISGRFTVQEASDLSLLLRAGALPAPLNILEERSVGPSLGADSIRAGKFAAALGFALVIVFMVLAYGLFGLAAIVALLTNLVLIAGALSLLQATLTLPGIAGIVLTIGMAVDANVLVFERIREEIKTGKTPFAAVDAGYRRALTTIIDSNVTTFIAAFLLFILGSGPVRGFGVTLSIGIATSMFTAVMLTRMVVVLWLRRRRPATLPI
jgi:preprotein translocase subunit SecD